MTEKKKRKKTFKNLRKSLKKLRRRSLAIFLTVISRVAICLPFKFCLRCFECFSVVVFRVLRRRRQRVLAHLSMALGRDFPESEIQRIARATFLNHGRSITEVIYLNRPDKLFKEINIEVEGEEYIQQAFEHGKGLIFATAHFGNWELMAAHMARLGHKVNVVATTMHDEVFDHWLNRTRQRGGASVIKRGKRDLELFRCLKRNEGLGILYDLDTKGSGMFIDFFAQPAYTQTGPVALSMRTGAPIVIGLIHREGRCGHRVSIKPPLFPNKEMSEDSVQTTLEKMNNILEREVREYPSEWAWSHRRWRHKPELDL